jgi:elongation factor Ts
VAEISAAVVAKLRNATGLSMMECKKALSEAGGDLDKAEDILRKAMKGKMDTKTDRAAGEGRVAVKVNEASGVATIVELRAETDFTAKNENFIKATQAVADLAITEHAGEVKSSPAMAKIIDELRISTGENISLARAHKLTGATGTTAYGSYVHHDGKTGVLIQAEGSVNETTLRQVCMHIAAAVPPPAGVSAADVPQHIIDKEKNFRLAQAMESGKPKEIAEKMVEGGMRKFFEEVALLEQPFVMDPTKKIKDVIGPKASVIGFLRWKVGQTE